jgi:hypothetical protein
MTLPIRAGFTDLGVGSAGSALIAAIIASEVVPLSVEI